MRHFIILPILMILAATTTAEAAAPQTDTRNAPETKPTNESTAASVRIKKDVLQDEDDAETRRCAFLGRCGSFTLIGSNGTAAYILGKDKYIADLKSVGQDPNWWLYRPTADGDPWTRQWAFARKPERGKYRVLRFANGAWREFERTEAWGSGLGGSVRAFAPSTEPSNQQILNKLLDIEGKLNAIQPGSKPSLQDIEKQLQKNNP